MNAENSPEPTIDWEHLARQVGALDERGEHGGSNLARKALIEILGDREILAAVEYYINQEQGSELARSTLWMLQPHIAAEQCYSIYRHDKDIERRRRAMELFRVVADASFVSRVPEFFSDPDDHIQVWGASYLDQLVWASSDAEVSGEVEIILQLGEAHANAGVRETMRFIRDILAGRQARE